MDITLIIHQHSPRFNGWEHFHRHRHPKRNRSPYNSLYYTRLRTLQERVTPKVRTRRRYRYCSSTGSLDDQVLPTLCTPRLDLVSSSFNGTSGCSYLRRVKLGDSKIHQTMSRNDTGIDWHHFRFFSLSTRTFGQEYPFQKSWICLFRMTSMSDVRKVCRLSVCVSHDPEPTLLLYYKGWTQSEVCESTKTDVWTMNFTNTWS